MSIRIGILIPRSLEFPSIGSDLLDGLQLHLETLGVADAGIYTQNIGYGEDAALTLEAAKKLVSEHDVQLLVAYSTSLNAEKLYDFASTSDRPIIFLDAGMEFYEKPPISNCFHITLQGLDACWRLGQMAGVASKNVISAISYLDAGYRSLWAFSNGVETRGSSITSHFVSNFNTTDFTLEPLQELIKAGDHSAVVASFSSYLNELFFLHLYKNANHDLTIPYYCSPFMADEQLLKEIKFPGGIFITMVSWSAALNNIANQEFVKLIREKSNKEANIFHLLGWDAAVLAREILHGNDISRSDFTFESPRGTVTLDNQTHCVYGPLYAGQIRSGSNGNCVLEISNTITITVDEHRRLFYSKPDGIYSRWKNNYFCI